MLGRFGKKMRGLLQKEINLEKRVAEARAEREPLSLSDEELLSQFRASSSELEEAKREARKSRLKHAQHKLAEHVIGRMKPRFFLHNSQKDKLVAQLPSDSIPLRKTVMVAEEAKGRNFLSLGLEKNFPGAVDWFTDFGENSWIFGADSDLRDVLKRPNESTDSGLGPVEATWDLNRHGHFVDMGRTYWITGWESMVSEFIVQAVDWIERNPALFGINWLDPTTISARTVNWMLALSLFGHSDQMQAEVTARILKSLVVHGAVLADMLEEPDDSRNSFQLLAAASALNMLSMFLPELKSAQRWYDLSAFHLSKRGWESMGRGGYHLSGSAARHRELMEWLLLPEILHRLNGLPSPKGLREATETACESLALMTPPDRVAVDLGAPGGHSFLGRHAGATAHSRRLLALGSVACQRDDFRPGVEMPDELWWWLGSQAQGLYQSMEVGVSGSPTTRCFAEAGIVVTRDDWERRANWCLLRGSPKSSLLETAPAAPASVPLHDDALHLSLSLEGESVFVEPGGPAETHLVQPNFARISAHTAPRVGREREPLCLDRVSSRVETSVFQTKLPGAGRYLAAQRAVWLLPDKPWTLWREILFLPESKHLCIRDTLDAEGEIDFETSLLLSPHLDILMRGDMGCLIRGKKLQARLVPIFPSRFRYSLKRGQKEPISGWCYRNSRPIPTYSLRYFTRLEAPFSTYLWMVWNPNDTKVPRTEELDKQYEEARGLCGHLQQES